MSASISYLTVYNAHSGEVTKIPKPLRFPSLQKLKIHLLESFTNDIIASTDNIFLLTPFGIKLDYAMVNEMTEVYLYDRRLFQKPADTALVRRYLSKAQPVTILLLQPTEFSGFGRGKIGKSGKMFSRASLSIKEILESLKMYRKWTNTLSVSLRSINTAIDALIRHINVIFKALNILFLFASNFIEAAEKQFKSQFNYVKMLAMKSLNKSWKPHFASLRDFPVFKLKAEALVRLSDFLNEQRLAEAALFVSKHLPQVILEFNELTATINQVNDDKLQVDKFIEVHRKESMATFEDFEDRRSNLTREIDLLVAEISGDLAHLDTVSSDELEHIYSKQHDLSEQLYKKVAGMFQYYERFDNFKQKLAENCPEVFANVAIQQMKCVEVKTACKRLVSDKPGASEAVSSSVSFETFSQIKQSEDLLSTIVDLPLLFGFILAEKRRQFEWHDFYSKGIVSNVSEQLAVIIEHERVFQKLWTKKFGKFIHLISPNTDMSVHVPAVDVTLVNSSPAASEDSVLSWLKAYHIEREDIVNYISLIRQHNFANSERFADILERNFKSLVSLTERLKYITKSAASLASEPVQDPTKTLLLLTQELLPSTNGKGVDEDADLNLIKGLKSRIKKLEDLLHQQQFKNLTGWPVVKNEFNRTQDNKVSMLLTTPPKDTSFAKNPIHLLPKMASLRKLSLDLEADASSRKVLDASTTIDKHLDNIRLRKEIADLQASNTQLVSQNEALSEDLESCQKAWDSERKENENVVLSLHAKVSEVEKDLENTKREKEEEIGVLVEKQRAQIARLESRLDDTETKIKQTAAQKLELEAKTAMLLEKLKAESSKAEKDSGRLNDEVSALTAKLSDLQMMNAELMSNMQAKQTEFATERSRLDKQIASLEYKLEEKSEVFEDLMEVTQGKLRASEELLSASNTALRGALDAIVRLLANNVNYFHEFCVILESMGLLLVRELNVDTNVYEFRIRRVKGLRSKKDSDSAQPPLQRTKSTAVQEVTQGFAWIAEFAGQLRVSMDESVGSNDGDGDSDGDAVEAEARRLIDKCETFVLDTGGTASRVSELLKLLAFEDNVQLQAHDDGHDTSQDRFFSNGIIKRFNDVEGFAKKLTKENKAKAVEVSKCVKHSMGKILVRDFQKGDLVLFLPTRIERVNGGGGSGGGGGNGGTDCITESTPWTAFNIDAPHYFLDVLSRNQTHVSEEWIVSRIDNITEHVVSEENAQNAAANPFSLSVGITWYMVQTVP